MNRPGFQVLRAGILLTAFWASPALADFFLTANLQGGLSFAPYYRDPGLDRVIDRYNLARPTLTTPMPHVTSNSGYHLGFGFLLGAIEGVAQEGSVVFTHVGSPTIRAEGLVDGQVSARELKLSYNALAMSWAVFFDLGDGDIKVGPEFGYCLGQMGVRSGVTGQADDVDDAELQAGLQGSLDVGMDLGELNLPMYVVLKVYYRKMWGYGYADVDYVLTPTEDSLDLVDPSTYAADYGNVGVTLSLSWVFGAQSYHW